VTTNKVRIQPLKFAIATSSDRLEAWQSQCIENLETEGLATLRYVIGSKAPQDAPGKSSREFREYLERLDMPSRRIVKNPIVDPPSMRDGVSYYEISSDQAVSLTDLEGAELDFILVFGPRCLGLPLLNFSKYGVWYFVHGDIERFESEAPGFWEIYHDHAVTAAFLLLLDDQVSAGLVLQAAYLPTNHGSYAMNAENIFSRLPDWPVHVCAQIQRGATPWSGSTLMPLAPARYETPDKREIASLEAILAKNRKALYLHNALYAIDWNIAALKSAPSIKSAHSIDADVDVLCSYTKGQYVADPCLFVHQGRTFIFCELYSYATDKGVIAALEMIEGAASGLQTVIEEPFHLSYPQVFEHRGLIYCMPESGQARCVSLYRAIDFPNRWERAHTIIEDFGAVDSTIAQMDGKWWLFCTNREARAFNSHLHIWYAQDLLGPWTPHPKNPVKVDVRSSRPAGKIFLEQGVWYRPAQDCSRTYGGLLHINEILRLTETDFEERIATTMHPPRLGYNQGLHTISRIDGITVVDLKRYVFKPSGLVDLVRNGIKGLALRLGVSEETIQSLKRRLHR